MKVCIVGAGTAGLCSARQALQNNIKPTIFEQSDKLGGTWVYTDNTDTDSYGIDVHSSMYKGLRTNLPKEVMGYPDFAIPTIEASYISAVNMEQFFEKYATHFFIKEHIKFLHHVIRIHPVDNKWQVIVKDLKNRSINIYIFDYVMICNGHYNSPWIPVVEGSNLFRGQQLHSHSYRYPQKFKGEAVLVIGAGPSGMDLCNEISKVALRVTLSHHLYEKPKSNLLINVIQKPDVAKFDNSGAYFMDGSYETFTTVIFCTGYKYAFPFVSVDCGVFVDDNYVQHLYKHCVNINFCTMALIGLPFYVCAAHMVDLQARFIMRFWCGDMKWKTKEEMLLDTIKKMEKRWKRGFKKRHAHMMGSDQIFYYADLAETANIENIKPVMTKLHNESSQRFYDDLINFRKDLFRIIDNEFFVKFN